MERHSRNSSQNNSQKSKVSEYQKVSDSTVTNPDNLICDNCLNQDMFQKKLDTLDKQKMKDKEFAKEIQKRLQRDLE